ncbi:hypothetical protein MKX03_020819, partial [Papaver bracteatum]
MESNELKHLEIINNDSDWCHDNVAKIIHLSTPKLTSLICKNYMVQEYFLHNVSSLVTVDIEIVNDEPLDNNGLEISEEYPKRMMEFISAFHNIQELTISSAVFLQ